MNYWCATSHTAIFLIIILFFIQILMGCFFANNINGILVVLNNACTSHTAILLQILVLLFALYSIRSKL